MSHKTFFIVVSVILIVILFPTIVFSLFNTIDQLLYGLFGMFFNMMKLIGFLIIIMNVIFSIVLIVKGIKALK